ncbi:MAG: allantoinase AllB [Mariniblastus sp.]
MGEDNKHAISSRRVVTPDGEIAAMIVIVDGKIESVQPHNVADPDLAKFPIRDFGELVISPGIVDSHVHINEPARIGETEWEGFYSATSAAAAGGVTTILDMPLNSIPVTTTTDALLKKIGAAQGRCRVDVGFYGGLVPGNEGEIDSLLENGVLGVKAFMCHSGLAEFAGVDESILRTGLSTLKKHGVPLLAHAEIVNPKLSSTSVAFRSYTEYAKSRPPEFELAAVKLLIKLCREFETPIHIVHLATAKALPMIRQAKDEGLPLTVETCPHYLFFSSEEIDDGKTSFKCAPPIRDAVNRDTLCRAVESGLIETIGSDHSPCPPELKQLNSGDFVKAWGGIAGLQLSLPVVWTTGKRIGWTPTLLAKRLSERPAEIFGIGENKGKIACGFDADLVVWNPDDILTVRGAELFHRHSTTPYEGRILNGVVQRTYLRGQLVFENGNFVGSPKGQPLQVKRNNEVSNSIARFLNEQGTNLPTTLQSCCASQVWISGMLEGGSFSSDEDVMTRSTKTWNDIAASDQNESAWLEAFTAHPRIGDIDTLREKFANTKRIASGEQSGVNSADESTLQRLAAANDVYFDKFGFIFIVCATGKSAEEMLTCLEERLSNDRETELKIAANEQLKITQIRLRKLVS